jgi:hypothetical protein
VSGLGSGRAQPYTDIESAKTETLKWVIGAMEGQTFAIICAIIARASNRHAFSI